MRFSLLQFLSNKCGNVAIIFGLVTTPTMVLIGGGVDYAQTIDVKSKLQFAIDASVLAAAGQEESNRHQVANSTFEQNIEEKNELLNNVTITTPIFAPQGENTYTGRVSANVPTNFLKLIGMDEMSVTVSSTARVVTETATPCILLLDSSSPDSFEMISSSNVRANECEVHVHSNHTSSAASFSSLSSTNFKRVCVKGGASGSTSNLETECTPAANPYQGQLPVPTVGACSSAFSNKTIKTETLTIPDGTVFCGNVYLQEVKNLTFEEGGFFVVKDGELKLSAKNLNGNGVTFYFAEDNARLSIDSEDGGNLSAPNSGIYKDILMFMPDGLANTTTTIISTNFQNWTGIVYVPSWDIELISPSSWNWEVSLVANTLNTDSVSDWEIQPYDTKTQIISGGQYQVVLAK